MEAARSGQLHQPPLGLAGWQAAEPVPLAPMGLCNGKGERKGLNMATNQFLPVWGALVQPDPTLGC